MDINSIYVSSVVSLSAVSSIESFSCQKSASFLGLAILTLEYPKFSDDGELLARCFRFGDLHLAYALDGVGKHLGILVPEFLKLGRVKIGNRRL